MFNILNNSNNGSRKLSRSVKYTDVQPWPNAGHIIGIPTEATQTMVILQTLMTANGQQPTIQDRNLLQERYAKIHHNGCMGTYLVLKDTTLLYQGIYIPND